MKTKKGKKRLITMSVDDNYTPNVVKEIILRHLEKGTIEFCGEKWISDNNERQELYEEPQDNYGYTHEILFRGYKKDLDYVAGLTDMRARQVIFLEKCLAK